MKRVNLVFSIFLIMMTLGCSSNNAAEGTIGYSTPANITETDSPTPSPLPIPTKRAESLLRANPILINFAAQDGQKLVGYYYPSAYDYPAPTVVLMHWVTGDMSEWFGIAPWLQNRGLQNSFGNAYESDWLDPDWFPYLSRQQSYNVFIFTFRGCKPAPVGCQDWRAKDFMVDAQAAMQKVVELVGVDSTRIAVIGSSTGADAAVGGCLWLNQQNLGSCLGALSLSPCDCLNVSYDELVRQAGELTPSPSIWCFGDETDIKICDAASKLGNPSFSEMEFVDGAYGNWLLRKNVQPSAIQGLLDFLSATLGDTPDN